MVVPSRHGWFLGNLIDNAFEAAEPLPVTHRLVELQIDSNGQEYIFNISMMIPAPSIRKIFFRVHLLTFQTHV
ncbi:GHKL domain-containing protein [Thermanaerosceptrum fracticalcis]|uniref:GHKL domain-containing protein n=1 Tax=Thermanaerosceptrum fracticalcis TaxID=1712410 RepID=A0A7G6E667_THEFR|nr:GHKL domain-containing protein [Thermanaerosceptrum fracticalcis]